MYMVMVVAAKQLGRSDHWMVNLKLSLLSLNDPHPCPEANFAQVGRIGLPRTRGP